MRIILRVILFVILALSTSSGFANKSEANANRETGRENKMNNAEAKRLVSRLHDIRDMDKKALTSDQKRDLRKEVNNIKEQMQKSRPGYVIYISATALIIILLLILLL
jgi:hypothetical protein